MSGMRLTDSGRWDYAWFSSLPTELKLLFVYVEDHSDLAAVWPVNHGLAEYHIGARIDWGVALEGYKGQVVAIEGGVKWFLPEVLSRRHPAGLGASSLHVAVRQRLHLHKIPQERWPGGGQGGAMPMAPTSSQQPKPLPSLDSSEGGVGGTASPSNRERFKKFLADKRLSDSEKSITEWISFAREIGVTGFDRIADMIDWAVDTHRDNGNEARYLRHVEQNCRNWAKMKRDTERISKESA